MATTPNSLNPAAMTDVLTEDGITSLVAIMMTTMANEGNATSAPDIPSSDNYDKVTIKWFYFVTMGIVIILGMFFNILSIVVFFSSMALRRTSTGLYLIALMFADLTFLFGELLRWLNYEIEYEFVFNINFINSVDIACRMTYFIRYAAKLVSAWITVLITAERFLTVTRPLKVATISTLGKARIAIAIVVSLCLVLGAFPLWTVSARVWEGDGNRYCIIITKKMYEDFNMAILRFGSLIIPSIIITVLTIIIIVTLVKASRQRRVIGQTKSKGVQGQLTAMLVAVTIAFLILRIPYTFFWYLNAYGKDLGFSQDTRYAMYIGRFVTDIIATTNYATNFFLFCLCGSAFRDQLARLFCVKRKNKRSHSMNTNTTQLANSRSSVQMVGPNGYGNPNVSGATKV